MLIRYKINHHKAEQPIQDKNWSSKKVSLFALLTHISKAPSNVTYFFQILNITSQSNFKTYQEGYIDDFWRENSNITKYIKVIR